jgi:hypothetical protein
VSKSIKPLSEKPRRRGKTYCSPSCGRGCTHAEYLRAHRAADKALFRIKMSHPKLAAGLWVHVWENLGWHWCLRASDFYFSPSVVDPSMLTILAAPGGEGGRPSWMIYFQSQDAAKLLRAVLRQARAEVDELDAAVKRMEALL